MAVQCSCALSTVAKYNRSVCDQMKRKSGTQRQKKFVFTIFGETVMTRKKETRAVRWARKKRNLFELHADRLLGLHLKRIIHDLS